MLHPVMLAQDLGAFQALVLRYSCPALTGVRALLSDATLLAPTGAAARFRATLQRLLGHYAAGGDPPLADKGEAEAVHLVRLDALRREHVVLLLQWPQLLGSALWLQVVAVLVRRLPPPPASAPTAATRTRPDRAALARVVQVAADVAQELVFVDTLRLLGQAAPDPSEERPLKRRRGAQGPVVPIPPAAAALRAWQQAERERWRRWVHLGLRRQPPVAQEDQSGQDGGLHFTLYADLINILHSQFVPDHVPASSLTPFLSVDPTLLRPNSELFLFQKGCLPLWEATPLGANLDHDFDNAHALLPLWSSLALAALQHLFWEDSLGLQGFSLVKRWNGRLRLTLWLERYEDGAPVPLRLLHALPPHFQTLSFRYRPNAARIAKHVLDEAT